MPALEDYDSDMTPDDAGPEPSLDLAIPVDPATTTMSPAPRPPLGAPPQPVTQLGLPSTYWQNMDRSAGTPQPDPIGLKLAQRTKQLWDRVMSGSVELQDNSQSSQTTSPDAQDRGDVGNYVNTATQAASSPTKQSSFPNVDMDFVAKQEGGIQPKTYGVGLITQKDGSKAYAEHSGVTGGLAVDLGQHSLDDYRAWGLNNDELNLVTPLLKLKGEAAYRNPSVSLNPSLIEKLDNGAKAQILGNLEQRYDKESQAYATPDYQPIRFADLPTAYASTIASLAWQGQLTPYWQNIVQNKWLALADQLQSATPPYADRRHKAGDYLRDAMYSYP
jgi:hypothetical protein